MRQKVHYANEDLLDFNLVVIESGTRKEIIKEALEGSVGEAREKDVNNSQAFQEVYRELEKELGGASSASQEGRQLPDHGSKFFQY